jgi:hypothetical protein
MVYLRKQNQLEKAYVFASLLMVIILPDSGERYITTQLSEQGE